MSLHVALYEFLSQEDWHYTDMDEHIVQFGLSAQNGDIDGHAYLHEENDIFAFYSKFPVKVPSDKRTEMAELLMRINYQLTVGNFEMDMDDGTVFFRTSIDVENDRLTPALVNNLVHRNFYVMDKYIPVAMSVIYGNVTPKDALETA